jgi:sulfur relay (sulfurtransferase) complex TusBCD TusD component (DsrE family)
MDAPYESENLTTAFRILDAMARRGHNINVFAFEGASGLAFSKQAPHPNPVHGKNVAEENHPTTKDQVTALLASARLPSGVIATAETESAAVPRLDGSSHTAPECRCRLQVRTRLTAGAKRIRTLGPTRVRRPRQPQGSLLSPRWSKPDSNLSSLRRPKIKWSNPEPGRSRR